MLTAKVTNKNNIKQRAIFKCGRKKCAHKWARNYFKHGNKPLFRRDPENKSILIFIGDDYKCPACNDTTYVSCNIVEGTVKEGHICDAKCVGATGHVCECSCGGLNHGANLVI